MKSLGPWLAFFVGLLATFGLVVFWLSEAKAAPLLARDLDVEAAVEATTTREAERVQEDPVTLEARLADKLSGLQIAAIHDLVGAKALEVAKAKEAWSSETLYQALEPHMDEGIRQWMTSVVKQTAEAVGGTLSPADYSYSLALH